MEHVDHHFDTTLKYSPKQFDKLVEYGNKYELSLDIMFRNSRDAPKTELYIL